MYPAWTCGWFSLFMTWKHSPSQTPEIQVPSRCPWHAWGPDPAGPRRSAAAGAPEHSGARGPMTAPRWCSAGCPIGWGGSLRRSCCTASPSAAHTGHAAASPPTASRPLRTLAGSSSVPRTVWKVHTHKAGHVTSRKQQNSLMVRKNPACLTEN